MMVFMAKLLRRFRFTAVADTKLDYVPGNFYFITFTNMIVKLERRN